jgi:hypothetical protein
MKKVLGIFFVSLFLLSIVLSTFDNIKSTLGLQMHDTSGKLSASMNPIKMADKDKVDFAKNK